MDEEGRRDSEEGVRSFYIAIQELGPSKPDHQGDADKAIRFSQSLAWQADKGPGAPAQEPGKLHGPVWFWF